MAKVKSHRISIQDDNSPHSILLTFSFDINVDKEGEFSTTIPKETVEMFKAANIDMKRNRLGNEGYFFDKTCEGLIKQIKFFADEYCSRELVSETLILKYCIQTQASYSLNEAGEVIPSSEDKWKPKKSGEYGLHRDGNIQIHASARRPYGVLVYAQAFIKQEYKYKSGATKIEYAHVHRINRTEEIMEKNPNLSWLHSLWNIAPPKDSESKIEEIEYTENIGLFFVNLIKSICMINEKIKDYLTPEHIKILSEKQQYFLT